MSDTDKMRGKKVDVSIIKLKKDNYMAWSQSVRDCFFCHKLEVFIEAADAATDATELAEPDDLRTDRRRAAWGKVTASLSTTDRQKTAKVKTGHVEMLLFKIRSLYHRKSLAATQSLRKKLMNLRVDDYEDLSEMFLELDNTVGLLSGMGVEITDEAQLSYILAGVSGEFDICVAALLVDRRKAADIDDARTILLDYEANILKRNKQKSKSQSSYNTYDEEKKKGPGVCFKFARTGSCQRGSRCRYQHVSGLPLCGKCSLPNHRTEQCQGRSNQGQRGRPEWQRGNGGRTRNDEDGRPNWRRGNGGRTRNYEDGNPDSKTPKDDAYGLHDDGGDLGLSFPVMGIPFGEPIAAYSGHDDDADASAFYLDSGTTIHVVNDEGLLWNVRPSRLKVRGCKWIKASHDTRRRPSGYRVRAQRLLAARRTTHPRRAGQLDGGEAVHDEGLQNHEGGPGRHNPLQWSPPDDGQAMSRSENRAVQSQRKSYVRRKKFSADQNPPRPADGRGNFEGYPEGPERPS